MPYPLVWVNLSNTKNKIGVNFCPGCSDWSYRDRNWESIDWRVGVLFFLLFILSPVCRSQILTVPLWFLDEDQRTYWQSSLVQQHPSTPGCCLYANIGLSPARATHFLSFHWLYAASFILNVTPIQIDKNVTCGSFFKYKIIVPAKFNLAAFIEYKIHLPVIFWGGVGGGGWWSQAWN